jgi:hypothetical protein
LSVAPFSPVADTVTEEKHNEEFGGQYRESEQKDLYREQELSKGFEDSKSNLFLVNHIYPVFKRGPKIYEIMCMSHVHLC